MNSKTAISLTSLALLLTGCARETPEQARNLDSISCPELSGPDEFRVTSRSPAISDLTDSVGTNAYGLVQPTEATTGNGSSLRIESDGPEITKGRLTLKQAGGDVVLCAGAGSLVRQEYFSDEVNNSFRARARFVHLSQGAQCDQPLEGEVDMCFTASRSVPPSVNN